MLLLLALLAGAPDFTASRFEAPATAREGDVVEYRLTVLNSGDAPSLYLEAKVQLPARALRVAGDLPYDPVERTFQGPLALGPGEQRELRFRVLAAPGSNGTLLAPMASILAVPGGTVLHGSTEVGPRRPPDAVASAGGFGLTAAGAMVLAYLGSIPLVVGGLVAAAVARGRAPGRKARGRVVRAGLVLMLAVGFLLIFVDLARRDVRLLNEYREAACEVLDTTAPAQVERTRGGGTMASFTPLVAVRFTDGGVERVGAGFDGPSRLRIGGGRDLLDEMQASFRVGANVPCWYDPHDPARIVVKRGPGGAYAFAVLPLGLLVAALAMLRSAFVR